MREGPLADLFRSTERPDDPPEPPSRPEPQRRPEPEPEQPVASEPEPEPEPEPPARDEAPGRPAKDRLRDVFSNEPDDREPAYGRSEPSRPATAPPQVNDPLIRVVGVGGGGVNAVNRMV
jgi:cell division protein FtsZ